MDTSISQIAISSDTASVEKARQLLRQADGVSGGVSTQQRAQAHKIGQDFEALFLGMMMKSMRATVGQDALTGGGHGEEAFRSLLDQEYATVASKRGVGLAPIIEKEIIRQEESRNNLKKLDQTE
jgi:flagellar protein FlgJ